MLKITHYDDAGFFSGCSVKLYNIIKYFNNNKTLPSSVDTSDLFYLYKSDKSLDITFDFVKHYDTIHEDILYDKIPPINIKKLESTSYLQFANYKDVEYNSILPFVKKYCSPSTRVLSIKDELISKYNINPSNCIGLYYRGTDKYTETQLDTFESYYDKLADIIAANKDIQILIQTDSAPFIEYIQSKSIPNVIIIEENSTSHGKQGIHKEKTAEDNHRDLYYLFATFLIIADCKYVICSSGNCSIWMMYYRGGAHNVCQNLNRSWL